ncbi:Hypothetical protein D9617_8g051790 [Elsinoe fawcettii]|nr:Hypothetical protein D9617_8g051790 [Elsinoe fawcettii]
MDPTREETIAKLDADISTWQASRDHQEQEEGLRDIIRNREDLEGRDASVRDRYNLAATLIQQSKFEEAEELLRDVLSFLTGRDSGRESEEFREQEEGARALLQKALEGQGKPAE